MIHLVMFSEAVFDQAIARYIQIGSCRPQVRVRTSKVSPPTWTPTKATMRGLLDVLLF